MSKAPIYLAIVIAAAALERGSASAQGKHTPALDADIETTYLSAGRTSKTTGRYYRSRDGRTREESRIGAVIMDVRSGTFTLLNFTTKEARVFTAAAKGPARAADGASSFAAFAETTVEGHSVTKARKTGDGGRSQELWTAKDLGLVVMSKVDTPDRTVTRVLRNVSLREPDPAVFQIPPGYKVTYQSSPPVPPGSNALPPVPPGKYRVPRQ